MIGAINNKSVLEGCGWSFYFHSESKKQFPRIVFSSDLDEKKAWMNIDGLDVELSLAHSTEPSKEKIGSRSTRTYVAASIRVLAVYVTARMCGPNEKDCESTDYDATFTVTRGERKRTIKLKGGCGC